MATIQELAQELRRVLELLDQAMAHLDRAAAELGCSITSWTHAMSGSLAPESGQIVANMESRARVGSRPIRTPTSSEWVRSDGETLRINSGDSDRWYREVVSFIRTHLPERYRRALAVATHCEAKVAVAMRDGWTGSENVVVDKTVCGTRTFDSHQKWTCDKLLPMLLPPGTRLTVVQGDGTSLTYVGEKDPA